MPWAGGTYTKGNNATGGWTGDATLGIGIEAGRHDTQDNDFATGINNCLTKDGTNSATADLNLGGFKPINIAAGTAAAPAVCVGNDSNTGIFAKAADTIGIATNGIECIKIDSLGQLVVRNTTAGTVTQIENWANNTNISTVQFVKSRGGALDVNTIVQNGDGLGAIRFYGATGTSYAMGAVISGEVDGVPGATNDMPGRLTFHTTPDGSGNPLERMRITNAGNVGIGVTPTEKLDVNGPVYIRTSTAPTFDSGTRLWAEGGFGANYDSFNHRFNVGAVTRAEAMRISSNGQVSIGTTATGATLFVQNNLNNTSSPISAGSNVAGDVGTAAISISKKDNNSTTSQSFIQFLINGGATGSGQINANGASQAAFGTYSDARLKQNITDLPAQLNKILALRPVEFDYKDGSGHQIGFIAQEVQEHYPDLVAEDKDEYLMLSGLGKNEARLIKAIQELAARIEALESLHAA